MYMLNIYVILILVLITLQSVIFFYLHISIYHGNSRWYSVKVLKADQRAVICIQALWMTN